MESTSQWACSYCGIPLDERDLNRGICYDCRSPHGKVADLEVAILASGDSPSRLRDWPEIRAFLRKRFGEDCSDKVLWEKCVDWFVTEGELDQETYLGFSLLYFKWLLKHGFRTSDQLSAIEHLKALEKVGRILIDSGIGVPSADWEAPVSISALKNSLIEAVIELHPFYGGNLPSPGLGYWNRVVKFLQGIDGSSIESLTDFSSWIVSEISKQRSICVAENVVEIVTVGDLWQALEKGRHPAVAVSAITVGPPYGSNIIEPKYPKEEDQDKWLALDQALALCDAEGEQSGKTMQTLIARIALIQRVDRREIINWPLAKFVEAGIELAKGASFLSEGRLAESTKTRDAVSPVGFLGGAEVADALGIHATQRDAFFRQLERQRNSLGDDCWHEVLDPRPNNPRFLYRADSPKLRDLAARYKTPKPA